MDNQSIERIMERHPDGVTSAQLIGGLVGPNRTHSQAQIAVQEALDRGQITIGSGMLIYKPNQVRREPHPAQTDDPRATHIRPRHVRDYSPEERCIAIEEHIRALAELMTHNGLVPKNVEEFLQHREYGLALSELEAEVNLEPCRG